ncbi:hypothetical protein [Listeria phage List-36]|nr:virion structural protein [Listeria phage A511]YP_007676753.1 virion structural protein [Listeria phage vB_LmoM_AG20]YP_008240074.1 hypothetical protein QLX35_gp156 [Listeria phage LP-125]YP_009042901.1 virion structural protein [Listeria phage LP-048]YP_009043102.1 virion structural protein [Listeria phage LMSP-25]YP_009043458.1 virion structural protein [Listeria phage List-36]YP_009044564.1 virion structural protein [Listeria phage LP-083-2]YP_009055687.1 virion structural protein [Lis
MASVTNQTVHTGNTVYLMIKGKIVGRCQSASGERSYGTTGVYEIGSIMPQEHVYLKYEGSLTVDRLRMRKEDLAKLGITALGEDILKRDVIDIVMMDNTTKEVIIAYRGCSAETYNEEIKANEIVSESARFLYLSAANVK